MNLRVGTLAAGWKNVYSEPFGVDVYNRQSNTMSAHPGISLTQSGSHYVAGRDIHTHISIVHHYNRASERRKLILDWLSEIASVNHFAIQSETYAKLAPNTGSWILNEPKFEAWLSHELGTFWGIGIPGAGKTVLTSFVVNHLQERITNLGTNEVVLAAYCRFNDSLTVSKIVAGLLRQLSEKSASIFSYVDEKIYTPCVERGTTPTETELVAPFRSRGNLASPGMYIAIDGLDELRDDVREKLVDILVSLEQSVFLTSRELSLDSIATPDIRIEAPAQDFHNFISHEVKQLPKIWSLVKNRKDVLDELVNAITSRSDGMFLLAALQLSTLRGITNVKNLRKALGVLPTSLTDMYRLTFERIMSQSEEESTLACRAILWVTHARRPLNISELLEALIVEEDSDELDPDASTNEETLISVCCGLIVIEHKTQDVRLIHYTTHTFFSTRTEDSFQKPHTFAATICLVYLRLAEMHNNEVSLYMDLDWFCGSHPFAEYCCKSAGYHISHAEKENDDKLPPDLYDLLSGNQSIPLLAGTWKDAPIHYGSIVHFSAINGLLSMLETLQGSFNEDSQTGGTPLLYASIGGHAAIVKTLLNTRGVDLEQIDVNARGGGGETALHYASHLGHESIVRILLDSPRIDVNACDDSGSTPLYAASTAGNERVVQLLVAVPGIDVNASRDEGYTALHISSQKGFDSVVRILLSCPGTDVNARNDSGQTPLHMASEIGHKAVVKVLIRHPDIDINAIKGEDSILGIPAQVTALDLAEIHENLGIVSLLRQAGGRRSREDPLDIGARVRRQSY